MAKKSANLNLKAAIVLSGKNMAKVAEEIGMTKAAFSRKANGLSPFKEVEMEGISKILGVPVTDIFFKTEVAKLITENYS